MSESLRRILASTFYRSETEKTVATQNSLKLKSYKALFNEEMDAKVWRLIDEFLLANHSAPSHTIIQSLAKKALQEDVVLYVEELSRLPLCGEDEFRYFLKDAFEDQRTANFGELLAETTQILMGNYKAPKKSPEKKGYKDAFQHFVEKGIDFVYQDGEGERLRGNIRNEGQEMIDRYNRVKQNEASAVGILTGFNAIDTQTQGIRKGEMWLTLGFTSDGKSTVCLNIAHNAVTRGYNVLFVSLEMSKEQLRDIIYCIHTGHRKFRASHPPLKIDKIRQGRLSPEEEDFYFGKVISDFTSNPNYGSLYMVQPERAWSVERLRAEAELHHRQVDRGLDLVVVDYVNLMERDPTIRDPVEGLNKVLRDLKQMALTFSNGDRVSVVSPFQSNREGRKRAEENGGVYDLSACSSAHEAERSSDVVFSVFSNPELKLTREAVMAMQKGRDTGCCAPFKTFADFTSRIVSDANLPAPSTSDTWVEDLMLSI